MRATAILSLVQKLLVHEAIGKQDQASGRQDQELLTEAAERVAEKLRIHLSKRIGQEGFRTLLARALFLTTGQFSYLSKVRVGADGVLVGLRGAAGSLEIRSLETRSLETRSLETQAPTTQEDADQEDADPKGTDAGSIALLSQFFALLFTFIGENLTLRMLSVLWPDFVLGDALDGEEKRL